MNKCIIEGRLKGTFNGFKDTKTIFEFSNGQKWKQKSYHYLYHYAYMPQAKVVEEKGYYMLIVEGVNDSIEVCRA